MTFGSQFSTGAAANLEGMVFQAQQQEPIQPIQPNTQVARFHRKYPHWYLVAEGTIRPSEYRQVYVSE